MACGCQGSGYTPPAERAQARASARQRRMEQLAARKSSARSHQGVGYRWTGKPRSDASS